MKKTSYNKASKEKKPNRSSGTFFNRFAELGHAKKVRDLCIDNIMKELAQWLQNLKENGSTSSYTINEFLCSIGMPERLYYAWMKDRADLQEAHDFAVSYLGVLREAGALHFKLEKTTVHKVQHEYSSLWKKALQFAAELQRSEQDKPLTLTVVTTPIPDSSEVKPLSGS